MSRKFLRLAVAFAMAVALPTISAAQDARQNGALVPNGGTVTVNKHGVCRKISNSSGAHILAPGRTSAEWSSGGSAFLNNLGAMPGVSVSGCSGPHSAICGPGQNGCLLVDWWGGELVAVRGGYVIGACRAVLGDATVAARAAENPGAVTTGNQAGSAPSNFGTHLANLASSIQAENPGNVKCPISDYDDWYNSWNPTKSNPTLAQAFRKSFPYASGSRLFNVGKTSGSDIEMWVYALN